MPGDLVLGTMLFGTRVDRQTSFALLDRFIEAGGTAIDTADCYAFWLSPTGSGGQSESVLGEWLAADRAARDRLTISTKVGVEPTPDGGVEGLAAGVVQRAARRSAERLGTWIDLSWAHAPDPSVAVEETATAMGALVRDGLVRRLGASNFPTWQVERWCSHAAASGLEPVTALQLSTSYLQPRPGAAVPGKDHPFGWVTAETLDWLAATPEAELWAYSPLIQGAYDRPDRPLPPAYDHPGTTARLARLTEVATELGVASGQVVLAWLCHHDIRPVVGVSTPEQLDAALAAGRLSLDEELMARLDEPR